MSLTSVFVLLTLGQCAHSVPNQPYVRTDTDQCSEAAQEPCLYWTRPTLVWRQNRLGNPDVPDDEEFEAVRRSFASWQQVLAECGNMELLEGPLTDERVTGYASGREDNLNLVLFRTRRCRAVVPSGDTCWAEGSCGDDYDCWSFDDQTIAITLTTFSTASGVIYDSDIELNAAPQLDRRRFVFSASATPACGSVSSAQCIPTDVQNTMTHEVGHLLGLAHTSAPGSTMNPSAPPGDTTKRTVDTGSRDFVCTVYPRGQASQSCVTLPAPATAGRSSSSCAGAGPDPLGSVWLLLMSAGLLRLWRRA